MSTAAPLLNAYYVRRTDRAGSPTESLLSVTSHQQQLPALSAPPAYATSATPSGSARPTNARNPANNKRRPRPAATPTDTANGASASSLAAAGAGEHPGVTSSHSAHVASSYTTPSMTAGGWSGPVHAQLEGPGMPVARSMVATHPAVLTGPGVDGGGGSAVGVGGGGVAGNGASMDAGDGADDGAEADDGRLYCYCQVGSYGDMVACDDTECKHEWVSPILHSLFCERKTGLNGCLSVCSAVPFGVHWARRRTRRRVVLRYVQSQA